MGLTSVKDILRHASAHSYGVPAINVFNYESVRWAVMAAEEERMPIIIQFYPGYTVHISMKVIAETVKDLARGAQIPVGLHLDHARDFDTAIAGIAAGFSSVMIDGSLLPFDDNVRLTAAVKRVANVFHVDVEAELGHVGSGSNPDDYENPHNYTEPADVRRFVELTGVDSLAVSIGNGHGHYLKAPVLDFDRISAIKAETDVPLVLHGGSDIPDDQLRESVIRGMSKFNIATEYGCSLYDAQKAAMDGQDSFYGVLHAMEARAVGFVRSKIRLLNPNEFKGYAHD